MTDIHPFLSFNIAVILLLVGKAATLRSPFLQRYSIPEPVIGGVLCAAAVAIVDAAAGWQVRFNLNVRDFLLLLFFAGVGLNSDLATLARGGKPLVILLGLATGFIVAQNFLGISVAALFGLEPLAGLMAGSVSLTGGVGTTAAWAPIFTEQLGIANAMELGVASNMIGLIAACVIGGPIAAWLMRHHRIRPSRDHDLDMGIAHAAQAARLDYIGLLWAILTLNVTVMVGIGVDALVSLSGLTLPTFVSCLIAGIALRNFVGRLLAVNGPRGRENIDQGLSLLSDLALGLFLTMTLMGLQLWQLSGAFVFIAVVLVLQIGMTVLFAMFVVFRAMGGDYEAAVISAGFGGITLGSTATAIANMTAVTQQYGAAHKAFIIVPIVCGFFIDIVNALIIATFTS
ncbi:sodium/glutamate symporter [Rhodobacter sphaeroides]|uniref:sodium/glutamate symporter n=1 Tax=Cereibacter sphaeroides TaxID=1063 RepID=UPI001325A210|nr:sodium/glutamate symporter [Cereibacter sphaeroides]MWP38472.1 sodium/glutamate symporter [Cereibacter sphaeroides]